MSIIWRSFLLSEVGLLQPNNPLRTEGIDKNANVPFLAVVQLVPMHTYSHGHWYSTHAGKLQVYTEGSCTAGSLAYAFSVPVVPPYLY